MEQLFSNPALMILFLAWTITWKGLALWKAARNGSKPWFIALLLLQTMGLLEIIYMFVYGRSSGNTSGVTKTR